MLAATTVKRHVSHATAFLESLRDDVQRSRFKNLGATRVENHLKRHMARSKDNLQSLSSSLRSFLKYCAAHSYTRIDFSELVPRQRQYRHSSLPRGIDDSAIDQVLGAIDKQTPNGARDYAIVLLLMAYGIRSISACRLLLEDIDWPQATIRFRAQKGGKEVVVPLLDAVADAIIQWLRHRDPRSPCREVFLSTKAPHSPLCSMAVSTVVQRYMRHAGVHQPGRGAHTLRHSWAIRALQHDQPIKAIADVLGHRYIDTTFIYAKADLKTLRQVAMPWPKR
jgi:integrase